MTSPARAQMSMTSGGVETEGWAMATTKADQMRRGVRKGARNNLMANLTSGALAAGGRCPDAIS
jgi:hypothetical protein